MNNDVQTLGKETKDEITSLKSAIQDLENEIVMLKNQNFNYQTDIVSANYSHKNKKFRMVWLKIIFYKLHLICLI